MLLNTLLFDDIKEFLDEITERFDLQNDEQWKEATNKWFGLLKFKIYNWDADQIIKAKQKYPMNSEKVKEIGQAMIDGLTAGIEEGDPEDD